MDAARQFALQLQLASASRDVVAVSVVEAVDRVAALALCDQPRDAAAECGDAGLQARRHTLLPHKLPRLDALRFQSGADGVLIVVELIRIRSAERPAIECLHRRSGCRSDDHPEAR